jgi:putative ABC transport system substrate-binding protein
MKKTFGIIMILGSILPLFSPTEAQHLTKIRKIGFLNQNGGFRTNPEAFRQGMRELGYIEGQNITIEFRNAERGSQLIQLANELVQQKVEVIVTAGPAARSAKIATETVPIVFNYSGDPVEAGFVESLARPGRNMTGVTQLAFTLVGKRLEILKEAVPNFSRVAILASPLHPGEQREFRETQSTARVLGTTLLYNQVKDTTDVNAAFETIIKEKAHALLMFPDPVTNGHHAQIVEFAAKRHLPR